jgi:hypothetical protein
MKMSKPYDEQLLNAIADTWSPAVKAACAAEPSPEVIARIHDRAAQELGGCRRRAFFTRVRPFLVSAAAAALLCTATWVVVRPDAKPPQVHPLAALDGMLLLATTADEVPATDAAIANGTDTAALARRLLELQGFVDTEAEAMLTYL